jgi:hypothetical protein
MMNAMAPFVQQFNAYAEHDTQFARRRELPMGTAVLVFNLGPELRVEHPLDTRTAFAEGTGFYSGPSATYAVTETDGAQEGAQVMLTLPGARRLLGRPLGDVGDQLTEPADLLGAASAREMTGRLMEARSHGNRRATWSGRGSDCGPAQGPCGSARWRPNSVAAAST